MLWSTGFVATKYALHDAEPLTFLAIRMVVVVGLMAVTRPAAVTSAMAFVLFGEKFDAIAMVGMAVCALAVFVVNRRQ